MKYRQFIKPYFRKYYDSGFVLLSKFFDVKISIKSKHCGFFGDLAMTLNAICFAEITGLRFDVDWDKRSLYFDAAAGQNVWHYFFTPPLQSRKSRKISLSLPYFPDAFGFPVYDNLSERKSIGIAIERYCTPKPEISEIIENYVRENFSSIANLGVHYRGTDAAAGFENRKCAKLECLETRIADWLKQNQDGRIFLASDDASGVELLKSKFGPSLHSRDCIRSDNGKSIHGHYDDGFTGTGYEKGLDVLVDASLLSRCDLMLNQGSRVAWFAKSKNPELLTQQIND